MNCPKYRTTTLFNMLRFNAHENIKNKIRIFLRADEPLLTKSLHHDTYLLASVCLSQRVIVSLDSNLIGIAGISGFLRAGIYLYACPSKAGHARDLKYVRLAQIV